jgi:hypothetical protein
VVEESLPGPDQALVGVGGDFDGVGRGAVGFDPAVVVPVETGDRSEGPSVALIGLRPGR